MNHPHAVPTYVENLSRMLQVHEHPKFDPAHMRALQARVAALFSAEPDFGGVHGLCQATLIQFRVPEHAGTQGSVPTNLVHIPLYFQEIRTFEPLSAGQLQQRLAFAKETGHLLIGRDEVLAILHESEGGHIFCNAFECNTDGVPRPLYGIHADNVVRASRSKRICDLNITETQRELAEFTGSMYQWAGQSLAFNSLQVERTRQTMSQLKEHERSAPDERTSCGSIIRRSFISNSSTGSVSHLVARKDGWRRYPTSQDAWYYGVWFNSMKLEILTYAEQDVSHVICETATQFQAELKAMARFHGKARRPSAMGYGESGSTAFFDTLFLIDGDHRQVRFDTGLSAKDENDGWNVPMFGALVLDHPATLALRTDRSEPIPPQAFALDVLNPQSFVPHTAYARLTELGYDIEVRFVDGELMKCQVNLQPQEV